jgi:hypothetical protein
MPFSPEQLLQQCSRCGAWPMPVMAMDRANIAAEFD